MRRPLHRFFRRSRLSRSEIRFGFRRHDPVFAIQILFLRFITRRLVGERNGFEPLVANRQDFLANPFGPHEVGDGRRQMPGSLRGADRSLGVVGREMGPDVEQEGEVYPIVIVIPERESSLVTAYRLIKGSCVFHFVPKAFVHRSPRPSVSVSLEVPGFNLETRSDASLSAAVSSAVPCLALYVTSASC